MVYIFSLTSIADYRKIGLPEVPMMFRGRLVSKNQMTIPAQMQQELGMAKGDELEFVLDNGRITQVHVLRPVRVDLLPDDVLASLKRRAKTPSAGRKLSSEKVKELAEGGELEESRQELPTRAAAG